MNAHNEMKKCSVCEKLVSHWSLNGYDRCGECQMRIERAQAANIAKLQADIGVLKTGDRITITSRGQRVTGTVLSADNYGGRDGWYIEFTYDSGTYGYWKQGPDGGTVERAE